MKTKLFFSVIFLFAFCFVKAQVVTPQGVNYQAVVRDGSGFILANKDIDLQLSVLDSLGEVQWKEEHSVTTNAFGLVSVVLGEGTYVSGTQTVFSNIDWGADTYSLKTEVTYGGSTINLGANPIMAVPYAFEAKHAKSADAFSGEVQYDKINIVGNSLNPPDESLFEVKNADGQTIFAVYDGGVQVYVSNSGEKGIKGGFAVTGFGNIKGEETDILMVSPDSTVVYVGANAGKGIKGGFAVTGFGNIKGQETNLLVVSPDSTRVYVGANADKGIKGGFAVTGFGNIKGEESDLLVVNADSTRIYIGTNEDKGIKGGFAVGSFRNFGKGGDGGEEYFRVTRDSTRIYLTTDTLGNVKGGFSVETQIKDEATGLTTSSEFFSVAKDTSKTTSIGYETKALGKFSTAMGYGTIAKQPFETVLGMYNDTADYYYESIKADRLLTVGVGSDENTRKNAFTILKNGNVGIGVLSPSSWEKLIRPYEATTVIESNNVIITAPDETYGAYLSVGGGISAENLYLEPSYNEIDNNWLYPVISMYGGSIDANSLTLSSYYNENSHTDVPPSLEIYGGSISANKLSLGSCEDSLGVEILPSLEIYGGSIYANSLILDSYINSSGDTIPPLFDLSSISISSESLSANSLTLSGSSNGETFINGGLIETNNLILNSYIPTPGDTIFPSIYVNNGLISSESLSANSLQLRSYYDYDATLVNGGSISANNLTLNSYLNIWSEEVPPYLNVNGGSISADNLTLSGSSGDTTSINGGLISANSLILNSYSGGPVVTPPSIDVSGEGRGTVKSDIFMVNDVSLRMADSTHVEDYSYPIEIYNVMNSIYNSSARGRQVRWENGTERYAIFGQELEGIFPYAIRVEDGDYMVDYEQLVPILWQAVLELHQRVLNLE